MASAKYVSKEIVFQEIPNEISLCYYISNCPHKCPNCHSKRLWEDVGVELTSTIEKDLIEYKNKGVSCILFMGGDNSDDLKECVLLCKLYGFKTAIYSGCTREEFDWKTYGDLFDYIKIGPYIEEKGPLNSPTTNQRLYKYDLDGVEIDITNTFWKSKE